MEAEGRGSGFARGTTGSSCSAGEMGAEGAQRGWIPPRWPRACRCHGMRGDPRDVAVPQEPLRWVLARAARVLPPQKPTDEVGSCLESTLVLSGSTEPKAGLCRGPSPQPDLFPSFSLHPAHVRQGLLSSEVPLNEGIGDCSSTQPEMKDVWSPITSQPHTRERGAAVKSWPVPASARGLATQRPPSSHLSRRAFILSALDLESGFDR